MRISSFNETVAEMIMRKIAPSFREAMLLAETVAIDRPWLQMNVPLTGSAQAIIERGLGEYILSVDVSPVAGSTERIIGKQVFSTRQLVTADDQAAVIEHVCDGLKMALLRDVAKREAERLMGPENRE